jgi:hypothetical protein
LRSRAIAVAVAVTVAGITVAGCSERPRARAPIAVVPTTDRQPATPRAAGPGDAPFEVLDVPVVRASEAFTEETGRTMRIHPDALPAARCLRISVEVASGWRLDQLLDAFELALAPTGLEIARGADAYEIVAGPRLDTRRPCVDHRSRH